MRQLVGVWVQPARPIWDGKLRFDAVRTQVLADRVPRQPSASRYLTDREMISIMPASYDAQHSMSITPMPPAKAKGARFEHGSVLGGKTRGAPVSSQWKSTMTSPNYDEDTPKLNSCRFKKRRDWSRNWPLRLLSAEETILAARICTQFTDPRRFRQRSGHDVSELWQ
jgi:hypothetical protein